MQGVLDAGFLFLHLGLGGCADVDDGDTAGQLGQALLQLLAIVVGGGLLDLAADLAHASLNLGGLATPLDHCRVFLVHHDALGAAKVAQLDGLELDPEVLGDAAATGEDGDVLEHGLAAVAEAGCLDGGDVQRAADAVHDERGQGLALDVLGDDEHRLAGLGDFLEQRHHVLEGADLLLVNENVGVLEAALHGVGIGGEVRREVALVELHALDNVERGLDGLGLLDSDGAVLADLVHGVCDDVADFLIPVGGHGGDLLDLLLVLHLLGCLVERLDGGIDRLLDATLDGDRAGPGGDVLEAAAEDGLGQDGRRGGTVTGGVAGVARHFAHHLGAHVLVRILEIDLLGHGDTILGDCGGAELLVENDVAALGAEGRGHGLAQDGNTLQQGLPRGLIKLQLFC